MASGRPTASLLAWEIKAAPPQPWLRLALVWTAMAKADENRSSKPIDPSSLPIIEALAGRPVATVFEYVQLNTVTAKVVHDAVGLMYERTGIPQIEGTNRNDPPAPELDAATTTAATAQEIWTMYMLYGIWP